MTQPPYDPCDLSPGRELKPKCVNVWHQTQFVCSDKNCDAVSSDTKGWRVIERYKLYFCHECCKKHKRWLKEGRVVK